MESDFVAWVAVGKEVEWLRNLVYEIPLWHKLISPTSIRCDSECWIQVTLQITILNWIYQSKLDLSSNNMRKLLLQGLLFKP